MTIVRVNLNFIDLDFRKRKRDFELFYAYVTLYGYLSSHVTGHVTGHSSHVTGHVTGHSSHVTAHSSHVFSNTPVPIIGTSNMLKANVIANDKIKILAIFMKNNVTLFKYFLKLS